MRIRMRSWITFACAGCILVAIQVFTAGAQQASGNGPDPREIPVPRIKTPLGILPGVNELPVRKELPDVMVMNDGTKVTTRRQWEKRREEMKRILAYYAVGKCRRPREMSRAKKCNPKRCWMERFDTGWST